MPPPRFNPSAEVSTSQEAIRAWHQVFFGDACLING